MREGCFGKVSDRVYVCFRECLHQSPGATEFRNVFLDAPSMYPPALTECECKGVFVRELISIFENC